MLSECQYAILCFSRLSIADRTQDDLKKIYEIPGYASAEHELAVQLPEKSFCKNGSTITKGNNSAKR